MHQQIQQDQLELPHTLLGYMNTLTLAPWIYIKTQETQKPYKMLSDKNNNK